MMVSEQSFKDVRDHPLRKQCNDILNDLNVHKQELDDIYKEYAKDYASDRKAACQAIQAERNKIQARLANQRKNKGTITENTRVLKKKEEILKRITRDVQTHTAGLDSLKVQTDMRKGNRVRIGPSALPFFHVPVRVYVFVVLVLCFALLGLVVFLLLRGAGAAEGGAAGGADEGATGLDDGDGEDEA